LVGCTAHPDEADLQSQFADRVYPIPTFNYEIVSFKGQPFGMIKIPKVRIGPCVPLRDYGDGLRRLQIYFRRGSKNDVATPEDAARILSWFGRNIAPATAYRGSDPAWDVFLREVHHFDSQRHFLLITGVIPSKQGADLAPLGAVPWSASFDFDPNSDASGILAALRTALQERRSIHLVTMRERPTFNLRTGSYWFFARGLSGRDTVEVGKWQSWQRVYGAALNEQMARLASACAPTPVTIVVLSYEHEIVKHLRTLLEGSLAAFGSLGNIVIVTDDTQLATDIAGDVGAIVVQMPVHQLCSGVRAIFGSQLQLESPASFPSSSGAPLIIPAKDQRWLEEEFDLVTLECGQTPPPDREVGRAFLQGNEISWFELGVHSDVERDVQAKLYRQVTKDLEARITARINLYHAPGAGGTTVAKRIAWNAHREYPTAILRRTIPAETADRVAHITSSSGLSVLLIVDGSDVAEKHIDDLYDHLRARHIPALILQVIRRSSPATEGQRSFFLREELSAAEAQRFKAIFSKEQPAILCWYSARPATIPARSKWKPSATFPARLFARSSSIVARPHTKKKPRKPENKD
jgi:hypothetical protein